jgi:hypothetical protein
VKKILLAMPLFLLLVSPAGAAEQEFFGVFSLEVAAGWKVSEQDKSVRIFYPDGKLALMVGLVAFDNKSAQTVAQEVTQGGSREKARLTYEPASDLYLVDFESQDSKFSYGYKDADDSIIICLSLFGDRKADAALDQMLKSVKTR